MTDPTSPVTVLMQFDAADPVAMAAVLARYVVLARGVPGCRNIDLYTSATVSDRFVVVQKWDTAELQAAHLDSDEMVAFAADAIPHLAGPPMIDLLDPISAHDLA